MQYQKIQLTLFIYSDCHTFYLLKLMSFEVLPSIFLPGENVQMIFEIPHVVARK